MWRTRLHRGRTGERGSFSEDDYIAFLDQAHQCLRAPIVLIWDNLNTHVSRRMHALIAARPWLTAIRLPAYAPAVLARSGTVPQPQPHDRRQGQSADDRSITNDRGRPRRLALAEVVEERSRD
ncbi:hypothetical protein E1193_18615 [Micromonospora sp. KC606]|uniref:transposase n=1 Tax=Micromonospora sp. KC606 TaxID=2530379 RepID=UPI001042F6A2|nr:transposase [Micromonospora sp. KC606]TDC79734.1 hypothetical protein E1193_18615 [Micromonospora sp. KC606]